MMRDGPARRLMARGRVPAVSDTHASKISKTVIRTLRNRKHCYRMSLSRGASGRWGSESQRRRFAWEKPECRDDRSRHLTPVRDACGLCSGIFTWSKSGGVSPSRIDAGYRHNGDCAGTRISGFCSGPDWLCEGLLNWLHYQPCRICRGWQTGTAGLAPAFPFWTSASHPWKMRPCWRP